MRWFIGIAAVLLAGAAGVTAAFARPFDIYIYGTEDGREIYAFSTKDKAVAIRVDHCKAEFLNDPLAHIAQFRALFGKDDANVVTVDGPGSNVQIGSCADIEDRIEQRDGREPSLVYVRNAGDRQTRAIIGDMDALSDSERADARQRLGL